MCYCPRMMLTMSRMMMKAGFKVLPVVGVSRLRMGSDGTGVRTLIGTAGCPLRCRYCINPHSWDEKKARLYTVDQLLDRVSVDSIYFAATNGGITFGGGEPLLHADFIQAFCQRSPETWNFWVETCLNVPYDLVEKSAEVISHFVIDIKTVDPDIYYAYTTQALSPALENLQRLIQDKGPERITVRVPEIPGYADADSQRRSVDYLRCLGIERFDCFKYLIPSSKC